MGNASSIHYTPQDSVRASFCTNFMKDTTCGNQLQSAYNPFNACYSRHRSNPTEKSLPSYPASARSRTRKPIKIDTGNLNKAILLQIVNRCTNNRQPDFDDCNVPLSTEGSHKNTKAHHANHLLNRLDFDKLDADKTTTNSLDTSCIKSSPKATIFHPQAAIYFEYDKSQENQLLRFNPGQHDATPDISWEEPIRTTENPSIRLYYIESNAPKSTRTANNKENNLPLVSDPEPSQRSQRSHRSNRSNRSNIPNLGEIKPQIVEKTPEKPYQDIHKTEDRTTRRLCLKSKSATRQMNQEIIAGPTTETEVASAGVFQFKGDQILRNYGMISSEYAEPKKLERLLNSDSKASMPPSGRLSYTRDEKTEEIQQNGRLSVNVNAKPIPKHRLLLQANKMKRERSCELLSSGRAQSVGTRETTGQETTSVGRASLRTEFPLPRFTSPSKPEESVLAQQEQQQQIQLESKWQNFYTSVDEFKKEMDEVKKNNAWAEEQQRDTSQQRSQNISQGASPMNGGDPRVTHFTYATLSLSSSIPHYNNETNQKSAQDSVQNIIADKLKESVEQTPRLSPLREERLSIIREDKKEGGNIIPHHHHHGESFNTQHFGTGTVDLQVLQLKNSMETFDPPSSCYESNITYQLDKERDTCVVDLLAKDNNSEYNRENYQSVISDINQKIDGILKKCCIITEKSNKSQHPTLLSQSPNPTFIDDGVGEMILDDPALKTETNSPTRASPENKRIMESLRDREPNEIENIIGQCYTEILKTPENQGLVTMKDDLFVKQVIQPHPVEVNKSYESNLRNENEGIDSEPMLVINQEEAEQVEDFTARDYRQEIDVVEKVDQRNQQDDEQYLNYLRALKHFKEEEEEEQKIEEYNQTKTEENFRTTPRKTVEEVEIKEDIKRNSVSEPRLTAKIEVEEYASPEKTFSLQSENRNLSMQNLSIHNMSRNEKEDQKEYEEEERSVQQEITSPNKFESSFREEMKSQTENYNTPVNFGVNEHTIESPVKQMQQIGLNCSPQRRESPEKPRSHNSPSLVQNAQGWDSSRYPTLEIQRAAEELEALSKALHELPQHADNFVSTAGLNAVKQTIMEKIENIHGDILQRIGQLNKKVETKSPLGQRRNSVLDQTQDTRKFEYSTEIDARRAHSSMKEGTRLHYSFSSQAKTESQPQSYCPSPFQSQPREQKEQPRAFEPGLTFGQDNLELKAERAALDRLKKAQQKEKLAKFEPKQVSVSIMSLVDATAEVSVCTSTNNKSAISNKLDNSNKLDKADKHQQSIKQVVVEQNTNSKQSSPLSYRSSLLKSATRDGAIKINRIGKSNERDNDLEAVLSSTLRRDSSSEKETKKTNKSQQNSHRGLLSSQQIRQQQISNEKEIREAFNNRQPNSPLYMSHILGTESNSQKSRRGSYSEAKNTNNPVNPSEEMWVQEEIEKKKKLAVELMNLSSLRKTRELEMPEDCVRKMEDWARSETSSWSQIPTVREKKNSSQGILKVQDYLVGEGKAGARELNEYPMSALLAKQNQSDDTIFEECDTKRISTRDQGVQTVNRNVESFYLKQRRESKENGRGLSSLQNSMIDHSMSTSTIPIASKRNQSQITIDYNNRSMGMRTPERRRTGSKNICLSDLEMLDTKRVSGEYEERSVSRLMKKKTTSRPVEKQGSQRKVFKSGEKEKFYTGSNERNLKGLPRVSKSVRDNAIAISELMQAYVLEQKERIYQQD